MENQKNKVLSIYNLSIAGLFFFLVPSIIGLIYNLGLRGSVKDEVLVKHLNKQIVYFVLSVLAYAVGFAMIEMLNYKFLIMHLGVVVLVVLSALVGYQLKDSMMELMFGTKEMDFSLAKTLTKVDPAYCINKG